MKTFAYLTCVLSIFLAPLLIALPLPNIHSNSVDSLDFFPLSVGNSWTYKSIVGPSSEQQASILDTTRISGKLYFVYSGTVYPAWRDTLHADSMGNIVQRFSGSECMLFKFSQDTGVYAYTPYATSYFRIQKHLDVSVPAGLFPDCTTLAFVGSMADDNVDFVFAPGVGIVKFGGPFYLTSILVRAIVDGSLDSFPSYNSSSNPISGHEIALGWIVRDEGLARIRF